MKFVKFLFVLMVLFNAAPFYAQSTDANIVGHVLDKKTGEHIPFAIVTLKGTMIYTTTDETGHFHLANLPEGEFYLEASMMGYKTSSQRVFLKKGETVEAKFEIEQDVSSLDEIVVTANRSQTLRRLAPALVNLLSAEKFEITTSSSVAEGLSFQPGVRVENNCQNCGFQQVRINGLDGPYTQILIDSHPIFNALSGVYGIEQLPVNMVDRVEVIRGGGSALFGSNAIAGTINIITKDPSYNTASLSHTLTSTQNGALDNITSLNASLVTDDQKMGLAIFGQNRERDGFDANNDSFTETPRINSQTLGGRLFLRTGVYSRLIAEYHHLNEFRRGGDSLDRPPHEVLIAEQVDHSINSGNLKYDFFSPNERHKFSIFTSMQHIARKSYYGAGKDPNAYGNTKDFTIVAGGQYHYNFRKCLFMPAELTAGIEFNYDDLLDTMAGYNRQLRQSVYIYSAFVQNEWKNETLSLLIGARADKHSMLKNPIFSPRVNLRYTPVEMLNLRASYSLGFRAPQAFDEDLHIDNVGGTVSMIVLDENLKEERSQNVSLSADIFLGKSDWRGNILVEGFYTRLSNVFALKELGLNSQGILVKERYNESGAQVFGATLEGKVGYRNLWQLQAGFTWQRSMYDEAVAWCDQVGKERRMFRSPDTYGYLTSSLTPFKGFQVSITGTYTGSMLVEHRKGYIAENRTEVTPHFFDMGAKISYDIPIYKRVNLQIFAGVKNIFNSYQKDFDIGADRDSKYIYGPTLPRSYFAGMKLSY